MDQEYHRHEMAAPQRLLIVLLALGSMSLDVAAQSLRENFSGEEGTLEIGGPFVGAEFHHSRPVPSRISFFQPVANSIDVSEDYWTRDTTRVITMVLKTDDRIDTLGTRPFAYGWTPWSAEFHGEASGLPVEIGYGFCDNLPVMVCTVAIENPALKPLKVRLETHFSTTLRTSHTFAWRDYASAWLDDGGSAIFLEYPYVDTDSTVVFFAGLGGETGSWSYDQRPSSVGKVIGRSTSKKQVSVIHESELNAGEKLTVTFLIGSARHDRIDDLFPRVLSQWRTSAERYGRMIEEYATIGNAIRVDDSSLTRTARWSKAVLASCRHFLNGSLVPMPCPAQYNFYFTHDVLLTDLGAVMFDCELVRSDLEFLTGLTGTDSILAHAYYWKDDGYRTEYCGPDNWNHFWFILLSASYLRHSGDSGMVAEMFPLLEKSLSLVLAQMGDDGLIHGKGPDWWDIGNVPGARAYHTALAIRVLDEFVYLARKLGREDALPPDVFGLQASLKTSLVDSLWDAEAGYLLNYNGRELDRHYYAGSLVAAWFDLLDEDRARELVETATRELLDENIGVRVAMPADFHLLGEEYNFNGPEAGAPYLYLNGAVWPQSIAWYALAQIANGQVEDASSTLRNYLTIDGVRRSVGGQPSFFEFRNADRNSVDYGRVDKPTFLWMGGWYLYTLYHLVGVREEPSNIRLSADIPPALSETAYDLEIGGGLCRIDLSGQGGTFREIRWDGRPVPSAVLFGKPGNIRIKRGPVAEPYLERASAIVSAASFTPDRRTLQLDFEGIAGQPLDFTVVSPYACAGFRLDGDDRPVGESTIPGSAAVRINVREVFRGQSARAIMVF